MISKGQAAAEPGNVWDADPGTAKGPLTPDGLGTPGVPFQWGTQPEPALLL